MSQGKVSPVTVDEPARRAAEKVVGLIEDARGFNHLVTRETIAEIIATELNAQPVQAADWNEEANGIVAAWFISLPLGDINATAKKNLANSIAALARRAASPAPDVQAADVGLLVDARDTIKKLLLTQAGSTCSPGYIYELYAKGHEISLAREVITRLSAALAASPVQQNTDASKEQNTEDKNSVSGAGDYSTSRIPKDIQLGANQSAPCDECGGPYYHLKTCVKHLPGVAMPVGAHTVYCNLDPQHRGACAKTEQPSTSDVLENPDRGISVRNQPESSSESLSESESKDDRSSVPLPSVVQKVWDAAIDIVNQSLDATDAIAKLEEQRFGLISQQEVKEP